MNVLGIDTAGPVTGLALVTPHQEWSWSKRIVKGADALLLEQLENIVATQEIDAIALSIGPGSFTSLRVGVSIALGFAVARNIPVIPVSSLAIRAAMFPHECCLTLLDARRGKVYAQCFDSTTQIPNPLTSPKDCPLVDILPKQTFIAVGEGASVYRKEILDHGGFVPRDATRSPALMLAQLGIKLQEQGRPAQEISINYVRGASVVPPKQLGVPVGQPHDSINRQDTASQAE